MCGILGVVTRDDLVSDRGRFETALDAMAHRGPDDRGVYLTQGCLLGHRRLSILDLSPAGHQPMLSKDERYVLVYNGEVYNYRDIRRELMALGHPFRSDSDSEVVLVAYAQWGPSCLKRFNGMFALAVWDTFRETLFLARDHLGIKPLYYTTGAGHFAFASELKGLLALPFVSPELDPVAVRQMVDRLYVPTPRSILARVRKMPPGTWLEAGRDELLADATPAFRRWWSYRPAEKLRLSEEEWLERIEAALRRSVSLRMISDVPFGAFLSGGVDSSLVVAFMSQAQGKAVKTFSVGYGAETAFFDELPFARRVAERYATDHHELIVEPRDFLENLDAVIRSMDEPLADPSCFLTWMISRFARARVTVVETGIGGDEVFAGYPRYMGMLFARPYLALPATLRNGLLRPLSSLMPEGRGGVVVNGLRKLRKFLRCADGSLARTYDRFTSYLPEDLALFANGSTQPAPSLEAVYQEAEGLEDWLERLLLIDLNTYLVDDLLMLGDKTSMAHSLEVRLPLLDQDLLAATAAMPSHLKLGWRGQGKYILKKLAERHLPREVIYRPKKGFTTDIGGWINGPLKPSVRETLSEASLTRRGVFDPLAVARLLDAQFEGRRDYALQVYALYVVERWAQAFLD